MKRLALLTLIISTLFSCQTQSPETAYFITKLGKDTLAIERFTLTANQMKADVVLRSPRTSLRSYTLAWDENQNLSSMTATDFTESRMFGENGRIVQRINKQADSLVIIHTTDKGDRTLKVPNQSGLIPFIDMVHWPYEIAFARAMEADKDSIDQWMITGRRNANFIITRNDKTSYHLRHPTRGVMAVTTARHGEMMSLDASQTTRKLKVERAFDLKFDQLASAFAISDQSGSPFGTLSPPIVNQYKVGHTNFEISYGSPAKRGRAIYGGIVAYGQRWRTGANRATHFKTDSDLIIDGKIVPAGEYTLFTIPESEGGTLIINKQTGQNGQSYDASLDFIRVPMHRSDNNQPIESFTITVEERNDSSRLNLKWDQTIYYIDFNIKK